MPKRILHKMIDKEIFMLCEEMSEEELPTLNGELKANIKYDGERVLAIRKGQDVILMNRRSRVVNLQFPEIVSDIKRLDVQSCILDGEIVAYDGNFNKLQSRALTQNPYKVKKLLTTIPCYYMAFDILQYDGKTITTLPLKQRLAYLDKSIPDDNDSLLFIDKVEYGDISLMLKKAQEGKREGIVIKDMNSYYESRRSKAWRKLKFFKETAIVVTHYTQNSMGIRAEDDSGNAVQIAGRKGEEVKGLIDRQKAIPICVQYLEKTAGGRFRFPSFRGLANG